ncbi:MAG: hypothetical protein MI892_21545 [Desulfobacterales bacterium]|nr:hypothetical protein [Desulfobacterales bacterium]
MYSIPGVTRRTIRGGFAAAVVVLLTGCFEINHHLTVDERDRVVSFFSFRMEKALFELAAEIDGEEMDYGEFLREADMNEERFRTVVGEAVEVDYMLTETEGHFGFASRSTIPRDSVDMPGWSVREPLPAGALQERLFSPFVTDEGVVIPLEPFGDAAPDDAAAFLSGALYSLTVGKSLLPTLTRARVVGAGSTTATVELPVADLVDFFLIEIPLTSLFLPGERIAIVLER